LNLRTFYVLDLIWLNHNWHLNHHMAPTVPWVYLPFLPGSSAHRGNLLKAYVRMWRGPQPASERVQNRYAGRVIN
jgi:fatty acid desaturase